MRIAIYIGALVAILTSCGGSPQTSTSVYMETAKVFDQFEMKKNYDERMESDLSREVNLLDSLKQEVNVSIASGDSLNAFKLRKQYYVIERAYNEKYQKLSTQYTNEVNVRLNEYVKLFAEENDYDFVMGSSGQGNIMYAKDDLNITEDLIEFINKKYTN